jgi:hypothetical protein
MEDVSTDDDEDVSTDDDEDDEELLVYTANEILKIGLLLVGFRRRRIRRAKKKTIQNWVACIRGWKCSKPQEVSCF